GAYVEPMKQLLLSPYALRHMHVILAALLWAATLPALAETELRCVVRSVHDGDSMRVQCPGERRTIAVRMHQIDAPELEQPYGKDARNHLRRLCRVGSTATIYTQGRDQYGRLLGDVYCAGKSVNEEMVSSGSAWIYDRYVEYRSLYRLQDPARPDRRWYWTPQNPRARSRSRYEQCQYQRM